VQLQAQPMPVVTVAAPMTTVVQTVGYGGYPAVGGTTMMYGGGTGGYVTTAPAAMVYPGARMYY